MKGKGIKKIIRRKENSAQSAAPPRQREEVRGDDFVWLHLQRPSNSEIKEIGSRWGFHPLDLEDVLSHNQRPKLDLYDNYLFLILHFPYWSDGRVQTVELDVFVGDDFVVTISSMPLPPLDRLLRLFREGAAGEAAKQGSQFFLYRLVDDCFDYCFPMLHRIGTKLDELEEEIFSGHSREVVRKLSNTKQEIINFRKIIRPGRPVLRSLEKEKGRWAEMELYFGDTIDAQERVWDMLENYKEVVDALTESNDAELSREVNNILRVLTSISVIVLPLTLIASLWGMNVGVPGGGSSLAFWLILAGLGTMFSAMVIYFRRRGWL